MTSFQINLGSLGLQKLALRWMNGMEPFHVCLFPTQLIFLWQSISLSLSISVTEFFIFGRTWGKIIHAGLVRFNETLLIWNNSVALSWQRGYYIRNWYGRCKLYLLTFLFLLCLDHLTLLPSETHIILVNMWSVKSRQRRHTLMRHISTQRTVYLSSHVKLETGSSLEVISEKKWQKNLCPPWDL